MPNYQCVLSITQHKIPNKKYKKQFEELIILKSFEKSDEPNVVKKCCCVK
jgi:hypothetical protein